MMPAYACRLTHCEDQRNGFRPAATSVFLSASLHHTLERGALPDDQRAAALDAAELVRAQAQKVHPDVREIAREISGGAHDDVDEYNGRVLVADNGREVARVLVDFKPGVASDGDQRARSLADLRQTIKERTGVAMDVVEAKPGELERFTYKEKRWKDLRKQNL